MTRFAAWLVLLEASGLDEAIMLASMLPEVQAQLVISRRFGAVGVWYRSSHGFQPGCDLLAELTAARPGSPVGA